MTKRERILLIVGILAFLLIAGWAGESDYQEAVRAQEVYCQRVGDGQWPDFNHNFDDVCP